MDIIIERYENHDLPAMVGIWNEVVAGGIAFPQEDMLTDVTGREFFTSQTYAAVAKNVDTSDVLGLYILHPNNVGRCAHICNASYAVLSSVRGQHIGEALVCDSLIQSKAHGFRVLQFNAVVATNDAALHLYRRLGFVQLGVIPGGFRMMDGHYEDIYPFYHAL